MNEEERREYQEQYKKDKEKGVPFFPDILFKDAVISLVIFIALVALAYFVGAPLEPRADPADTSYTPRPEWYFLFLFQLLKYFPGSLEVISVFIIPSAIENPARNPFPKSAAPGSAAPPPAGALPSR